MQRKHRSRRRNGPKREDRTGPISAIQELSFLPWNSIVKAGCCVLLWQRAVFGRVATKPDISGRGSGSGSGRPKVINPVQRDVLQEHGETHPLRVEPFGCIERQVRCVDLHWW
jgi:hypothetical protein